MASLTGASSTVASGLVTQQWAKDTFVEAFPNNFFNAYMGDENSIIHVMHDLDSDAGDRIHYGLVMGLDETGGVTGDSVLIGSEEQMNVYDETMYISQLRNGVRLEGRMDEQKWRFNLRSKAKSMLKQWLPRAIDYHIFRQLAGDTAYTFAGNTGVNADEAHAVICGNTAWNTNVVTTEADMDSSDFLTTWEVDVALEKAKVLEPMIRPIRVEGDDHYLLVIHPYCANKLKYGTDTKWYEAMREGFTRGNSNPIFKGALGMWNGVIIREHRMVQAKTAEGSGYFYRNLFLGAQAATAAFAEKKLWGEDTTSDEADYGNRPGFMAGFIGGFKKNRFNSKDYGMITVVSYGIAMPQEDHAA
jgi:N4-gp56 family major capsid protein